MRVLRSVRLVAGVTVCGVAGFVAAAGALPALAGARGHDAKTTVEVTAGSPTAHSLELSKSSFIAAGAIQFDVVNKGKLGYEFRVCSAPTTKASANACVGKTTPVVKPGKTAELTVTLAKGSYEYLATSAGQGATLMKGLIGVAVKAGAAAAAARSSPASPGPAPATTTQPATTAAAPATSTTCNIDGTIIPC